MSHHSLQVLSDAVSELANGLPTPLQEPDSQGRFRWVYPENSVHVLLVCKAVRLTTSLKAAELLAESKFTTEAAALLRMATDFTNEIFAMAQGAAENEFTAAQERFGKQFFEPQADSVEELIERERERYVSRRELFAAHRKLAEKVGQDGGTLRQLSDFIDYKYDKYVHGSYRSAMELYDGGDNAFMLDGTRSKQQQTAIVIPVLQKLENALTAVEFVAHLSGLVALANRLRNERDELRKEIVGLLP